MAQWGHSSELWHPPLLAMPSCVALAPPQDVPRNYLGRKKWRIAGRPHCLHVRVSDMPLIRTLREASYTKVSYKAWLRRVMLW